MTLDTQSIEWALARGAGQQIGQYRLALSTGTWWWSPETYRLHGFEPGEVVPTTALILAHKHPDDRDRVRLVLDEARRTGEAFSSVHRIMDARGRERSLVVVGQGRRDRDTGVVVDLVGYFVDVSQAVHAHAQARSARDIAAAALARGTIEQAKGMVAMACGLDPDEAFEWMRQASNHRNVRLRDLARLVVDLGSRGGPDALQEVAELVA